MSGQEKLAALHQVRPGWLIHDIRFRAGGGVAIKGLRAGVVPETSPLANPNTRTFVATNSSPSDLGEIAVAIESLGSGKAALSLEIRSDQAARNVPYLQRVLRDVAEVCQVESIVTDTATATLTVETLEDLSFRSCETGEYELFTAA